MSSNVVTAVVPLEKPVQDHPEKILLLWIHHRTRLLAQFLRNRKELRSQKFPQRLQKLDRGTEPSSVIQELISAANEELATTGNN